MHLESMNYESLLEEAYENVKATRECGRFKILKVTGHHEGVRTIISNFGQIASCLRRTPEHLLKFLTKELASSGEIKGDRLILSRKLKSKDVNDKIERYANKFVLCKKCGKPDSEIIIESNKAFLKCLACGGKYEIQKI